MFANPVADHSTAHMSDMQRTGRVHAHKLHLNALTRSNIQMRKTNTRFPNHMNLRTQPFIIQFEVDETPDPRCSRP